MYIIGYLYNTLIIENLGFNYLGKYKSFSKENVLMIIWRKIKRFQHMSHTQKRS